MWGSLLSLHIPLQIDSNWLECGMPTHQGMHCFLNCRWAVLNIAAPGSLTSTVQRVSGPPVPGVVHLMVQALRLSARTPDAAANGQCTAGVGVCSTARRAAGTCTRCCSRCLHGDPVMHAW